jgi:hypothetical protein
MYEPDPRTWADRLCDAAPKAPARRSYHRKSRASVATDPLLAKLLTCGEFTSTDAAARFGCWRTSIRTTIRNHPDRFEQVSPRHGDTPAVWRAKRVTP